LRSNNLAKNSIRFFAIDRKNWLFNGSPKCAAASAAVYSIIETAKVNNLNPYKYLNFIFKELPGVQLWKHLGFLEDYLRWSPDFQKNCK
jgi:transposase